MNCTPQQLITRTKKPWDRGPKITLIDRDYVNGGGARASIWERTGHRINESITTGVRQTFGATPVLYNSAAVHS